jgi:type VI secretion system protein ImpE
MNAEDLVRAAQPEEALAQLQEEIRRKPEDARLRIFLFQLNCVLGRWEKALTQLQVLAGLNPETNLLARIFQPVIQSEAFRAEVFAGERSPLLFGEPAEWMGLLVQANECIAKGRGDAAAELRARAFEAAPATPGTLDGQAFAWIADADSRLGPMIEAIMEGRYFWVPFCRIKRIALEKPTDLRDLVWLPAQFVWANGGEATAHIPTRYPGSERATDGQLSLARKTDWREAAPGCFVGLGQRVWATDAFERGLLECRLIDLVTAA